jgi:isoquinoline 1-oxidoreductase subunit beta
MTPNTTNKISRRNFIRISGMSGAVLALGFAVGCNGKKDEAVLENISEIDPGSAKEITPFILIDSKGTIALISHKPEMGQGTFQSMPLIVAEELGVTLDQVMIIPAIADKKYGSMTVGGSNSVRGSWTMLRQAGAAAREMLLQAAAKKWEVPVQECEIEPEGKVHHLNSHRMLSFGELVEEASKLEVPKEPKLKDPTKFKLVGQSVPRPDILQKVEGKAGFGIDKKLEGMLYASVERCPFFGGKVKSFDDSEAKKVPGVKHVLIAERKSGKNMYYGVAVAADTYFAAVQGRKALKIEWDITGVDRENTETIYQRFRDLAKSDGQIVNREGDFAGAFKTSAKKVEAIYEAPFVAHAAIEPQNTVANVTAGKCEIWSPTQVPDSALNTLKDYLNIPEGKIELHYTMIGGGFGRRLFDDYITEAAYISREIKAPVKVLWTREDDMTMGPFRPGTLSSLKGAVDKSGKVVALQHKVVAPSIWHNQFGSDDPKRLEDPGAMEGIAESWYEIPNVLTHNIYAPVNIPIGWWRSVYSSTTAFAHECFIDELAHAAGKDPMDFRLSMISKNTRVKNLLQHIREKSDWDKPLPQGWGKGVAVWQFFAGQAGHVAFVSKKADGGIKIEKIVAVIDCGLAVNPDNVKAQVEGGTVMGISAAIKGQITFTDGKANETNFHQYEVLRMSEMPKIEVHIYPSKDVPAGVGEPGLPPVAPALGNAIFNLTGTRLRKLPFNLKEV